MAAVLEQGSGRQMSLPPRPTRASLAQLYRMLLQRHRQRLGAHARLQRQACKLEQQLSRLLGVCRCAIRRRRCSCHRCRLPLLLLPRLLLTAAARPHSCGAGLQLCHALGCRFDDFRGQASKAGHSEAIRLRACPLVHLRGAKAGRGQSHSKRAERAQA